MAKVIALMATLDTKGREIAVHARNRRAPRPQRGRDRHRPHGRARHPGRLFELGRGAGGRLVSLRASRQRQPRGVGAGNGGGRDRDHEGTRRSAKGPRPCRARRHPGYDPRHGRHARAAVWISQDHGLHHGVRERWTVGRRQRHHDDVLGDRHYGPQPIHAPHTCQRRRRRLRHGGGRGR